METIASKPLITSMTMMLLKPDFQKIGRKSIGKLSDD
jgi:hypothetical protein